MNNRQKMFLIKAPYWLGIGADTLWAIALFYPPVFATLTGRLAYNPDLETRLIMGIGGSLMLGWTFLLFWAVKDPIARRGVIIITAFPVVFGMFIITLIQYFSGNNFIIWAMVKTIILFALMSYSYLLAGNVSKNK